MNNNTVEQLKNGTIGLSTSKIFTLPPTFSKSEDLRACVKDSLIATLGEDNIALILQNHGLMTVGQNVDNALSLSIALESAFEVQLNSGRAEHERYPCRNNAQIPKFWGQIL